jgi:hypothetical protein
MAKLHKILDLNDCAKDGRSKVAYLRALVQKAVHRTSGKFKTTLKTKSFPASNTIPKGQESAEDVNVEYQQNKSKPTQPRKVETSNEQQPEKGYSFSIFDETDFDIDVFQLVDEGKWMVQSSPQLRDTIKNSGLSGRPNYNLGLNPRVTQDSLKPDEAKIYFPDGFPEDYNPPVEPIKQMVWPVKDTPNCWMQPCYHVAQRHRF